MEGVRKFDSMVKEGAVNGGWVAGLRKLVRVVTGAGIRCVQLRCDVGNMPHHHHNTAQRAKRVHINLVKKLVLQFGHQPAEPQQRVQLQHNID